MGCFFPTSCYSKFHKLIALCKEAFSPSALNVLFSVSLEAFALGLAPVLISWRMLHRLSPPLLGLGPTIFLGSHYKVLLLLTFFFMAGEGGESKLRLVGDGD